MFLFIQVVPTVMFQLKLPFNPLNALPSPELTYRSISRMDKLVWANKFLCCLLIFSAQLLQFLCLTYENVYQFTRTKEQVGSFTAELWFLSMELASRHPFGA